MKNISSVVLSNIFALIAGPLTVWTDSKLRILKNLRTGKSFIDLKSPNFAEALFNLLQSSSEEDSWKCERNLLIANSGFSNLLL